MVKILKNIFYFIAKYVGLFHLSKFLTRNHLHILCYHGLSVFDEIRTHSDIFMSTKKFEKRLKYLKDSNSVVLSLTEALEKLKNNQLEKGTVVLTFDDGFKDNHTVALPLLEKYNFPATVYVATYYVENQGPVFGLILQWIFRRCKSESVYIKELNKTFHLLTYHARTQAAEEVRIWGESCLSHQQRMSFVKEFAISLELPIHEAFEKKMFHFMNSDELKDMSDRGVNIELHTHRHSRCHSTDGLVDEIETNRSLISKYTGRVPLHFCYPSGIWNPEISKYLSNNNINSATTCDIGTNVSDEKLNLYELKRFLDGETISDLEFEAEVSGFAEILRIITNKSRSGSWKYP